MLGQTKKGLRKLPYSSEGKPYISGQYRTDLGRLVSLGRDLDVGQLKGIRA